MACGDQGVDTRTKNRFFAIRRKGRGKHIEYINEREKGVANGVIKVRGESLSGGVEGCGEWVQAEL